MKRERNIGEKEYQVLNSLVRQLEAFDPEKILLFGSFATVDFKQGVSDIDLCIIAATKDKRETLSTMYTVIHSDFPVDILLYTPEEWARCIQDPFSFAYHISTTGMMLVSRLAIMALPGPPFIIKGEDKIKEFLSIKPNQMAVAAAKKRVEKFNRICMIKNPTPKK